MRNNTVINCIAGVAGLGALAVIYFSGSGAFPPARNSEVPSAVGEVMAQQTLSLLKPSGQVIVIARDTATFENPAIDDQLERFTKTLRKANVPISQLRKLQVDPLRVLEVPPGDFYELIRKTPEGSVIVSFMGPPVLTDTQLRQLPLSGPAVVAFCPGCLSTRVDLRGLFEQKLLSAAVISRTDITSPNTKAANSRALFDKFYLEVTPANLATVLPAIDKNPAKTK